MSQLDISISFSHLFGLLLVFYIFLYYVSYLIIYYWYNNKFRSYSVDQANLLEESKVNNHVYLRRILEL